MSGYLQSGWYAAAGRALLAVAVVLAGSGLCSAAEVIDRIVATVNRHAILQSEWDEAVGFECLLNGRPLKEVTPGDRRQTLERMIDQELIAQQMRASSFVPATPGEVAGRVRELRQTVSAWKTDDGWRAALASYGLTEEDVEERTVLQVNLSRYLDLRFRPEIHIDRRAMENYYRDRLLPQLRGAGWPEMPFEQVALKIEQLLTEQRLNELQDLWVRALRMQGDIRVR
ncbi:MAG TPA: SurA N-terminal domain-containing protein [Terriglobales bacterium]|nr:SurA N-terminal domain-containing protein [Terriglobales bacterium]